MAGRGPAQPWQAGEYSRNMSCSLLAESLRVVDSRRESQINDRVLRYRHTGWSPRTAGESISLFN